MQRPKQADKEVRRNGAIAKMRRTARPRSNIRPKPRSSNEVSVLLRSPRRQAISRQARSLRQTGRTKDARIRAARGPQLKATWAKAAWLRRSQRSSLRKTLPSTPTRRCDIPHIRTYENNNAAPSAKNCFCDAKFCQKVETAQKNGRREAVRMSLKDHLLLRLF